MAREFGSTLKRDALCNRPDERAMNMLLAFRHSHSPCTRDELVELVVCILICEVHRLLAGLFGNAGNDFMSDLACETMRVRTYMSCDRCTGCVPPGLEVIG
jgi:hypothetical protein